MFRQVRFFTWLLCLDMVIGNGLWCMGVWVHGCMGVCVYGCMGIWGYGDMWILGYGDVGSDLLMFLYLGSKCVASKYD